MLEVCDEKRLDEAEREATLSKRVKRGHSTKPSPKLPAARQRQQQDPKVQSDELEVAVDPETSVCPDECPDSSAEEETPAQPLSDMTETASPKPSQSTKTHTCSKRVKSDRSDVVTNQSESSAKDSCTSADSNGAVGVTVSTAPNVNLNDPRLADIRRHITRFLNRCSS